MVKVSSNISFKQAYRIVFESSKLSIAQDTIKEVRDCYNFLKRFEKDKIIYGINTGFGPMAQYRIEEEDLKQLQYNIIRSHATGAGKHLSITYIRAALLARLTTFLQARSAVHEELVNLIVEFINNEIYPAVPEHGSVGASGDLVQLAHIALALIGEGEVYAKDSSGKFTLQKSSDVFSKYNLKPLQIHIREGLSVTNGTSMMTGIAFVNLVYAKRLFKNALYSSLLINEITSSYDDFMSEPLNFAKKHDGQRKVAELMRSMALDSKMLQKRENVLFREHKEKVFTQKVQSYYSLRCVPQILGPILEEIEHAESVIMKEFNSSCDNPIIDRKNKNVYHGGNFHGDYISYEMDKLKIAITKLTMLCERQLNYLCHSKINEILPPFLNLGVLGLNYGLQAAQFTATSTTAECQTLSNPMSIHTIPCNNDNQDIVSMGTNSAEIASTIIENGFQVVSILLMALCQAVDYLKIASKLSTATKGFYTQIREVVPKFVEDTPKYQDISNLVEMMKLSDYNL